MAKREPTERTCIVTRETLPVDRLIRFVVAPDGEVVPDLRRRLPGRGVWVTATAKHVADAEQRRLLVKAFEDPAKVSEGLAARVEDLLAAAALQALSFARKAGSFVAGFAKVEAALGRDDVVAVIHAAEAGDDGVAKLAGAAARRPDLVKPRIIRVFSGEQLDLALGLPNVVHAALLAGPASANVLARIGDFERYRGDDERPTATSNLNFDASTGTIGTVRVGQSVNVYGEA